jgi:hypothetical protein
MLLMTPLADEAAWALFHPIFGLASGALLGRY